ncbi:iron uptake porin [Pannus brasiliensis CCIBt3594]|uniref:Iron uptake porin n=1 Tax=Pannus brasiliensis CCIBt3594 TaxID=1427578 RepID=A0AAW9QKY6_9CHRO
MFDRFQVRLLFGSAILGIALVTANPSRADEDNFLENRPPMAQITSVSQLRDVSPSAWAYQALQQLVERYGCIVGYPDRTFRGDRALTRWEFAAGLNACLNTIERLLQENVAIVREDIDALNRLAEEFAAELAALGARLDNLEQRAAFLEDHQFSTTTKLTGEVIFALTDAFQGSTRGSVAVLQDRARLVFGSSFTGKDRLTVRLAASNAARFQLPGFPNNAQGNQTFNLPPGNGNDIVLDWLSYEFRVGDLFVYLPAHSGRWWDFAPTLNPVIGGGTSGRKALSIFAQFNPIYTLGGGAGVGLNYNIGKQFTFSTGYLAGDGSSGNPAPGKGLFNGEYNTLFQFTWSPGANAGIALTYVHAYQPSGPLFDFGTGGAKIGTAPANAPFSGPVSSNSYGASGFYQFNPYAILNGFFGYTNARTTSGSGSADIWYYGLGLGLPDLGKEGNLGGLVVGAEPYRGDTSPNDFSLHLEAFYKYQLTNNISITPGVIWITAPNQDASNPDAIIGTVRTTFTF